MNIENIGTISIICYVCATILAAKQVQQKLLFLITVIGLLLHLLVLWQLVILHWVNLSFYHALSFASVSILLSLFFTYRWYSLNNLLTLILPIVAFALWLEITHPESLQQQANIYLDTHILLSILAYSFLCIAAVLTLILFTQEKLLKNKKLTGLLQTFPPLAQTETTLFKVLLLGFILLSASLVSGFIFLDDIFAQHLSHKTFFSILSWILFATLLLGRMRYGWRGIVAVRITLLGFIMILLAYFGSKIVQELLLKNSLQ